jgi:sugar O-acyltransferase (sialic acid O-acetyltransferase NeuD family)
MNEIILIGAGGHACACIDVIENMQQYEIAGLVDKSIKPNVELLGYPILGRDDDLARLRKTFSYALITIGQIKNAERRLSLYKLLVSLGYTLPNIISPFAYVSRHAQVGNGTIIMPGAIVNANAHIGLNCIINSAALVEHDAVIGDHCHIATGAIINGEVKVGAESFVGSGTVTHQCISIGENCVIGAGAVLHKDVAANQIIKP